MNSTPLTIGFLIFENLDQADFTTTFEVLSRLSDSSYVIISPDGKPVRDVRGLILSATTALAEAPALDVLVIPGGQGVNAVMEDEPLLDFIRKQSASAQVVLSVCTGALICGAAGLLQGRRATCHWSAHHLLPLFGATAVNRRVVVDGTMIFAAGVTSGFDGALVAAARLRGDEEAQRIQLYMEYAPEPPFQSGSPETAPPAVLAAMQASVAELTAEREAIARLIQRQSAKD